MVWVLGFRGQDFKGLLQASQGYIASRANGFKPYSGFPKNLIKECTSTCDEIPNSIFLNQRAVELRGFSMSKLGSCGV